jgi:hypothetical protein
MRWLGLSLLCGGLSAGCLVPQDDHVLQDLPQLNHPPRIVEDGLSPQPRLINTDKACGELQFSAPVEDPDLGDLLVTQWFLSDFANTTPLNPVKQEAVTNATGQAIRKDPANFTLRLQDTANPITPGLHVVELLLSDGTVINRVPQPRDVPCDGGTGILTYTTTYAWMVNVADTGVCP